MAKKKKTNKQVKAKENIWKWLFLGLVTILLGVSLTVVTRLKTQREPAFESPKTALVNQGEPAFQIQLKKKQINRLIDYYLNEFLGETGVKYRFYLEDQAMLKGNFNLLGQKMGFYLYFEPYVLDNGNVLLQAKSLSIGTLSLPVKDILRYVGNQMKIPDWVEIQSQKEAVVLHLDQFQLQNGMYAKMEKINLIDDDIRMNIYLPLEKDKEK
ncbi:YpmS family protein [Vagococcus humatus]|nr:YpmS family protein [Vagococcus humatus]